MGFNNLILKNIDRIFTTTIVSIIIAIITAGTWLYIDHTINKHVTTVEIDTINETLDDLESINLTYTEKVDDIYYKIDSTNNQILTSINNINTEVQTLRYVVIKNNKKMKDDLDEIKKTRLFFNPEEEITPITDNRAILTAKK